MNQKIKVIALLCALVFCIVGAYFLYDVLAGIAPGAQLATPGGSAIPDTSNPSSSDENTSSSDNSEIGSENTDANESESSSGTSSDESQTENDHDHGEENTDQEDLIKAYDFYFYDINGNKVKLSDFYGKPIVLNFWASWCGACQSEMSAFDEVYNEYKDKITFLMVSVDDTMGEAQKYIQNSGYSFPYYHDTDYEGSITYGVSAIPITFFIDKDGHFVAYGNFAFDKATLMQGINMIYTP